MSHNHPHGKPENVLIFTENDNKVIVSNEPLRNIFDHPDVKNRKIVAFSIIGAYRKGKSFFLDYCLRFLYAHYKSINYQNNPISSPEKWMGEEDTPLQGFSWRSGSSRDTTGIVIWNDAFLHTIPNTGEKIAIVVMDTQGLFDNKTSPMDNSRIFALGTLISSIQVLNLMGVVQEDQLQYLQFATEFARFAREDSQGTAGMPFQNLLFLIRDWTNPDEFPFGIDGGKEYLESFLKIESNQKEELKSVRQFINDSFEELSCALLPNPGKIVSGGKKWKQQYDGNWGQMDEDFKEELEKLIKHLLSPDRLVMKQINGNDLKGSEFNEYVDQYFKLFQSNELPKAQSMYESTVEQQMNIIVSACFDNYKESIYKNQDLILNVDQIPIFHNMSKNAALIMYKEMKKMGNASHEAKFKQVLEELTEKAYEQWSDQSEKSIKIIEEEKEKTRRALEEKQEALLKQLESEREAAAKVTELERLNHEKVIDIEKYEKEKKIAEERLMHEQQRREIMEQQQRNDEQHRKELMEQMEILKQNANRPLFPRSTGRRCSIM